MYSLLDDINPAQRKCSLRLGPNISCCSHPLLFQSDFWVKQNVEMHKDNAIFLIAVFTIFCRLTPLPDIDDDPQTKQVRSEQDISFPVFLHCICLCHKIEPIKFSSITICLLLV